MALRDRHSSFLIGAIAILLLVLPNYAVGQILYQNDSVAIAETQTKSSTPSRARERRAEQRSKDDLRAQRLMAKAAVAQIVLTFISIVLLLLTVIFTAHAAKAAGSAAKAAAASVNVAEQTAERQLRAYISMVPTSLGGLYPGGIVRVQFRPQNHGETPAYAIRHDFGMGVFPIVLPESFELPEPPHHVRTENAIYPDSSDDQAWFDGGPFSESEINEIDAGTAEFRCWGRTHFRDIFEKDRHVTFNVAVSGPKVVKAQAGYRDGQTNLPKWEWRYRRGHNNGN